MSFAECADLLVGLLFAAHKNPAIAAAQVDFTRVYKKHQEKYALVLLINRGKG